MEYWVWAIITLVILFLLYVYGMYPYWTWKTLGLQGPKPLPFVGSFVEMRKKKFFDFFHEYTLKYGKVWACYNGRQPTIVVSDPDMLKQILVKEFNNFVNRNVQGAGKSKGIFAAKDDDWRRIRTILSPTFSALRMKEMLPLIHDSTNRLVEIFGEAAGSKKSTDISKLYGRFTMEVILSAAFGVQAETQTDPDDPYTKLAAKIFNPGHILGFMSLCFPFLLPLYFPFSERSSVIKGLVKLARSIIEARRSPGGIKRKDLLQLMMMSSGDSRDPAKSLTDEETIAQSITFLAAGYETTSTTLTFVSYTLATNPDVQEKLMADIDELFPGDQAPEYDQLQNIPYLDMVINETLRLFPTAFRFGREAKEACDINGVHIPKGVAITVPVYTLHRDPEYWPEPETFDPMRFSPEAKAKQHPYAFLPFGGGPRTCIGMRFALMEAKMALVMLLKKFKFERAPDTEDPLSLGGIITLNPVNGCYINITSRETKEG